MDVFSFTAHFHWDACSQRCKQYIRQMSSSIVNKNGFSWTHIRDGDYYKHEDRGGKNTILACWSSINACFSCLPPGLTDWELGGSTGWNLHVFNLLWLFLHGAYNILYMLHFMRKASPACIFFKMLHLKPETKVNKSLLKTQNHH